MALSSDQRAHDADGPQGSSLTTPYRVLVLALLEQLKRGTIGISYHRGVQTRRARLGVRAIALSLGLVLLTLIAHAVADGSLPGAFGLLVTSVIAVALAAPIARGRLSPALILIYFVGGQFLLHVLMALTGSHAGHAQWLPSPSMAASHVLAAVALTLCALYFDHAWEAAARMARTLIGGIVAAAPASVKHLERVPTEHRSLAPSLFFDGGLRWRGPPITAH